MIEQIRKQFVKYLVQKTIFCPFTGAVLDVDTCTVINDSDGDPAIVVSPEAGRRIRDMQNAGTRVFSEGFTLDLSTIRD